MRRALVLGIGNPLRGDDGFGAAVIDALRAEGVMEGVELRAVHQLTPELVDELTEVERVAFVDASVDLPPGELHETEIVVAGSRPSFTHHLAPRDLCALARQAGERVPRARVFAVGAESLGHDEVLSPPVREAVEPMAARVRCWALAGPPHGRN